MRTVARALLRVGALAPHRMLTELRALQAIIGVSSAPGALGGVA